MEEKPTWMVDLDSDDVRRRALAVQQVRQVDLDDLDLLDRVLALCNDGTALPDDMQPPVPDDPFAEFFGNDSGPPQRVTVGEKAAERLVFTGVIGKPGSVERIGAALDAEPSRSLVEACAKLLGETVWQDRLGAVKALVPRLHRHGAALYEVVVRLGDNEHRAMVRSALSPYNSRGVNELLNHGPSKPLMESALVEGITAGTLELDEAASADALTLLVSWDSRHAVRVAETLEATWPWAVLVAGLEGPDAAARLATWLDSGQAAPLGLVRKLNEALKSRGDVPDFPLDAWLRYTGGGVDVVRAWGAAGRCRPALEAFVRAWREQGVHAERGWDAAEALIEVGEHGGIGPLILEALGDDDEALWGRRRFERVACARPPIPGTLEAFAGLLQRHPEVSTLVVPALMQGFPADELRDLTERYIALAESRPVVRKPANKGLIHEERDGVKTQPFQAVVQFLGDPELKARLQEVLPFIRPE